MKGRPFIKRTKLKETSNNTLKRSRIFGEGNNVGKIINLEQKAFKGNDFLTITINNSQTHQYGQYNIFSNNVNSQRVINRLIDCVCNDEEVEEISLDEFIGIEIGFVIKQVGQYMNIIDFYNLDNDELIEDDDEILEDDEYEEEEELEEELEEDEFLE